MKKHAGILNAYYWVKEAHLKRLHTIWLQLCDASEKGNYGDKYISGCQGKKEYSLLFREILGQWNYSVCYCNGGYMLYICQNS